MATCRPCAAGTYQDEPGLPVCKACVAGHYCEEGAPVPTACAAGSFSNASDLTSQAECTVTHISPTSPLHLPCISPRWRAPCSTCSRALILPVSPYISLARVGRVLEVVALDEVAELEAVELGGHALALELRWGQI